LLYHQQLHSKDDCDFRFGNYTTVWGNAATFTVDCLARLVGTVPIKAANEYLNDRASIFNPAAGTRYTEHLLARYEGIGGLGQAYGNRHVIVAGNELTKVSDLPFNLLVDGALVPTSLRAELKKLFPDLWCETNINLSI
jgi:hypothetical protein